MKCEFCKIVHHLAPAEVLYENESAIAILDIRPVHYGHTLIIPRTHSEDFLQIPESELSDIMHATRVVTDAIVKALKPDGFSIFSNNGRAAGQSVFHFHLHITPRYHEDGIRFLINFKKYAMKELAEYGTVIRETIDRGQC
jgi:histidine triad (HIT) family protein